MRYEVIGQSLFDTWEAYSDDHVPFYEEQERKFLGLCGDVKEVAYVLNGKLLYIDSPRDYYHACDCMAIKEGADLVKFESGNIGFVGYYGMHKDYLEVVTDPAKVAEYAEADEEDAWEIYY